MPAAATVSKAKVKAKPATPKAVAKNTQLFEIPRLDKGEVYAGGIILPDGHKRHTILLPGEIKSGTFEQAQAWCKKQGGDAPDRIEQSLLFHFRKDQFRPEAYWSNTQSALNSDWAWCQYFDDGYQYDDNKSCKWAVRAVRRVTI